MGPIVAIVGRPNVGKSTLFNRLSKSRNALVDDQPGITRDRLYASVRWEESVFTIIDTGGFDEQDREPLLDKVREQVGKAIQEADRIIFMVDGPHGILPADEEIARILRHADKEVFLAVNKIDGLEHDHLVSEFYKLGLDNAYPLSAAHGHGLKSLMEEVTREIGDAAEEMEDDSRVRVAILGRPNVGKSSLINRILGSDRLLVSDMPGTTRDAVDTPYTWKGKDYLLIDTAGIRRKARVKDKVDKFSMIKAIKSLDRCHVAVILLDASTGVAEQDARICGYALERGRAVILAVNKWDLLKGDRDMRLRLENSLDRSLHFLSFAPRINLSALTGERVRKLFDKIEMLYSQFSTTVGTGALNRAVKEMLQRRPPPAGGRGRLKLFYATQINIEPPTFVVFVNRPDLVHFSYRRFMVNQLR
ncbi:MAG: ribosome biogenesis GTPase Der, partial [Deltaproteobacteria bacterium]|nr:ribosome biogenesis GTPase Der [Deltaproteobacteria bacterium]